MPALVGIGMLGGTGHIVLTESYRYASASVVAPFDYTSMIWALVLGYAMFGEAPTLDDRSRLPRSSPRPDCS